MIESGEIGDDGSHRLTFSHVGRSDTCILPRQGGPGAGAGADSSAAAVIFTDKMEMD